MKVEKIQEGVYKVTDSQGVWIAKGGYATANNKWTAFECNKAEDCSNSPFYVKNIRVDLTKESINEARSQAEYEAKLLGFKKHNEVLNIFKKTSITVACSRWDEPFGRTSLEAAANGCAVIITNKGGLPETVTDAKILSSLSVKNLIKSLKEEGINIETFYLAGNWC